MILHYWEVKLNISKGVKMHNEKEFNERLYELADKKFSLRIEDIVDYYVQHYEELVYDFIAIIEQLQSAKVKENGKYLFFHYLHSSTLMKNYRIKICLYNEKLYMDEEAASNWWRPPYIYDFIENDVNLFEKELKKEFVGVKPWQMEEFRIKYANQFIAVLGFILQMIFQDERLADVLKRFEIAPFFGEFMGKAIKL